MNIKTISVVLASALFMWGCASYNYTDAPSVMGGLYSRYVYIGYDGDLRDIADVGLVTTDGLIKLTTLDGKPVPSLRKYNSRGFYSGGRVQLHLLPGTYVLTMGFHDDRGNGTRSWSTSDVKKVISIAKGQVIHLYLSQDGRTWRAIEVDGSSALADITRDFKAMTDVK